MPDFDYAFYLILHVMMFLDLSQVNNSKVQWGGKCILTLFSPLCLS